MKKRFLVLTLAVALCIGICMLVACSLFGESVTDISVTPDDFTVEQGSTVDALKEGITVKVTYSDGSEIEITDFSISGFDPDQLGEQTVTVKFGEAKCKIKVNVANAANKILVQDALSSLKNQLPYYTLDDDYSGNLNGTASAPGLIQYISLQMPDLKPYGTTAVQDVTSCDEDGVHYAVTAESGLKSGTFYFIAYTKYYKGYVKCTYDTINKNFSNFTVNGVCVINEELSFSDPADKDPDDGAVVIDSVRKHVVQDALSSLRYQLQYYTLDNDYSGNLNGTASAPGLIQYLSLQMPDLKPYGTTAVQDVTSCDEDGVHYAVTAESGLKSGTFYFIAYTKYYKGYVKCTYDNKNKNFTNFTLGAVYKLGDALIVPNAESGSDPDEGDDPDLKPVATAEELETKATILSYVDAWLFNNAKAEATDLSAELNDKMDKIIKEKFSTVIGTTTATYDKGKYSIKFWFKNSKAQSTAVVDEKVANLGVYAGEEVNGRKVEDVDVALGSIINAAFKTIKKAVVEGGSFTEDGFSFAGKAYFQFNYGELTEGKLVNYGLAARGNIASDAKDTNAALELLKDDEVIGGLYYDGEAEKLYLLVDYEDYDAKYYIDNANINAIVAKIMDKSGDYVAAAMAEPFYDTEITMFSDLFDEDIASIIGPIVNIVFSDVVSSSVTGGTRYQVKLDLDALLPTLVDTFGSLLGGIDLKALPAPLNQLDLATFQGIGGVLVISATVLSSDGTLSDLEISYNCSQKDFRFNANDTESKIYGPINFALGIDELDLGAQDKDEVLCINPKDFDYFSPLNAEITADFSVTTDDVTNDYRLDAISQINPFIFDQGKASVIVTKKAGEDYKDFINIYFDIASSGEMAELYSAQLDALEEAIWNAQTNEEWEKLDDLYSEKSMLEEKIHMDCKCVVVYDGVTYQGYLGDIDWTTSIMMLDMKFLSTENVLTPLINYVSELVTMFEGAESEEIKAEAGEEDGFGIDTVFSALSFADKARELINSWSKDETILKYDFSNTSFWDNYLKLNVNYEQYNEVMDIVAECFTFLPADILEYRFDWNAATIFVNYNYGDYEDMAIVKIEEDGATFTALIDYAKWERDGILVGNITLETTDGEVTVYEGKLVAKDFETTGEATFTYTVKEGASDAVKYIDFALDYNKGAKSSVTLKLYTDGEDGLVEHIYVFTAEKKDNIGIFTATLDDAEKITVYGGNGFFTAKDVGTTAFGIPCIEFGCEFGYDFSNSNADVKINSIKLENWGLTTHAATAPAVTEAQDINVILNTLSDAFFNLFATEAEVAK